MRKSYWAGVIALAGVALVGQAHAATMPLTFSDGAGVSGSLVITFGPGTDAKYPTTGFEITGVSGTFTDTNIGIDNAAVTSLVPINHATPLDVPPNLLAPDDFSHFAVANGLPAQSRGFITYDNLFWPGGAPPTASAFDGHGSVLDIYGLMFGIGDGRVVDLFSNGVGNGLGDAVFGVVVATSDLALDTNVSGGISLSTPEPSTWAMMVLGFAGLGFAGYRSSRKAAAIAA
ncbi:MAG TPA: PEP-CTERM sorting domain-containing protein [Roseiarcus sp.]